MADWYGRLMSERVEVDGQFAPRLRSTPVTSQQWGLLMTAIEFEIINPEEPERARIVPDVSKVDSVLEDAREAGDDDGAMSKQFGEDPGLVERVKLALGLAEREDPLKRAAKTLASEYATLLQEKLEEDGKWEETCERAARE